MPASCTRMPGFESLFCKCIPCEDIVLPQMDEPRPPTQETQVELSVAVYPLAQDRDAGASGGSEPAT